eukprot:CAMPEP_0114239738 /NCGR_PEP_ID=MMETSP0058-20121206/8638_1 /TAXON_ID=36894 /ORGANISM="Pyramimonas parkeae, CCMP726" /LENGTH=57 /DNA_ID=CAMNT_0001351975 /DNA_START=519 /DNA_END=692 /DNA_ORIENTATION=-
MAMSIPRKSIGMGTSSSISSKASPAPAIVTINTANVPTRVTINGVFFSRGVLNGDPV